jgi:hypothetical protein
MPASQAGRNGFQGCLSLTDKIESKKKTTENGGFFD